jgi:hypothetical protein
MATRITVEIGQALLAQKAKAIAEQNREQRLERERQAKEQAQIKAAADKAAADRAKAGTETDKENRKSGVPEYYTPPKVAAIGRQEKSWLLVPSDAGFKAFVRGLRPFAFTAQPGVGASLYYMQHAPGQGPSGKNALYTSTTSIDEVFVVEEYRSDLAALSGIKSEPSGKSFTFEAFARLPDPLEESVDYPWLEPNSSMVAESANGGVRISIGTGYYFGTPRNLRLNAVTLQYGTFIGTVWSETSGYVGPSDVVSGSAAAAGVWHHLAIVQTPGTTSTTRNLAFYIDGTRYFNQVDLAASTPGMPLWNPGLRTADIAVSSRYGKNLIYPTIPFYPTLTHGIRFTSRALYTGTSFTPPTSIVSLS